jgi:hypothetical protein
MAGTVTLSLEVELGWGMHDLLEPDRFDIISPERRKETETLFGLLDLCDRLDIQITFDVVGHLFLEECSGRHESPHRSGWFDADPGTSVERDPLFYAPDMIERIRRSATDHELASHTFSHALFEETSREALGWDLEKSKETHESAGLEPPRSLVPPRHQQPDRALLREHGIDVVRLPLAGNDPRIDNGLQAYKWLLTRQQVVEPPAITDGIVETPCTSYASLAAGYLPMGQLPPHPVFRVHPTTLLQRRFRSYLHQGLRTAAKEDGFTHYWAHLYDISNDTVLKPLVSFLRDLAEYRDRGAVEVATMDELAEETSTQYHST